MDHWQHGSICSCCVHACKSLWILLCLLVWSCPACTCLFPPIYLFIYLFIAVAHGSSQARGQMELQLPAYTTARATRDLGRVHDLHHSSWLCQIHNPLIKVRDWTHIFMDISRVCYSWATMGTPKTFKKKSILNNLIISRCGILFYSYLWACLIIYWV